MNNALDISVVIGFKNWGLNRLRLAITSVQEAMGGLSGEVIVSDYGSTEFENTRRLVESLGAIYIYTSTDGVWSRSRALNIGFAKARGRTLACTDADMIFLPGTMEIVVSAVDADPKATVLLECRDLPQNWSDVEIAQLGPDWPLFERIGKLRGRWGMGGMVAVSRQVFHKVRGLDERMHTYGCEDIDFGERTQRAGNKIVWLSDPGARMFHMWHPHSGDAAEANADELKIVNANREILYKDKSYIRNTTSWLGDGIISQPLVTIAIATRNRAKYLPDAVHSVLAQTVQDFEIVIIDDGSSDETPAVVKGFNDDRIRYFYQDNQGIAAARNRAVQEARGRFVAVLDDDDIMLPWRLEAQLASVGAGQHGSYGAFVNFDDSTGRMTIFNEKSASVTTSFKKGGAPGHSTWLVETDVLRRIPYLENIVSGEDNNVFLRMLRSGIRLAHCREIVSLRRLHSTQITQTDGNKHVTFAGMNHYYLRFGVQPEACKRIESIGDEAPWVPVRGGKDFESLVRPYLPDHLISRKVNLAEGAEALLDEIQEIQGKLDGLVDVRRYGTDGKMVSRSMVIANASHRTLAQLRTLGVDYTVQFESDGLDQASLGRTDYLDAELNAFVQETLPVRNADRAVVVLAVSDKQSVSLDLPDGCSSVANEIVVAGNQYFAHVVSCPTFPSALGLAKWLKQFGDFQRVDILLNDAAKRLNSAAVEVLEGAK